MARIKDFQLGNQRVKVAPTEVTCFFQLVDAPNGDKILHLSTFGSSDRQSTPKSSQSIQLDRAAAGDLMNVIWWAFAAERGD